MLNLDQKIQFLLRKNPMVLFLKGLFLKWSLMLIIPAISGMYVLFTTLQNRGILDQWEKKVTLLAQESQAIMQHCLVKLTYNHHPLRAFMECVENPPAAQNPPEAQELINNAQQLLQQRNQQQQNMHDSKTHESLSDVQNPYDEE